MLKIGLTGGIGTGKTTIAKVFKTLGVPYFDADTAAKDLMQNDKTIKAALAEAFGKEVYQDNQLNKVFLANKVFKDKSKLALLNSITHPATIAAAKKWMRLQKAPYIIKEAALLFEAHSNKDFDFIIGIDAPIKLRINRVMERNNISEEAVLQRIKKQIDNEEKMSWCDFVINNDEQMPIIPQVVALHNKFIAIAINKS